MLSGRPNRSSGRITATRQIIYVVADRLARFPGYRVIVEVALDDRLQPSSGLGQRMVHAHSKLLLDLSQLASHAFADRRAPYHEAS